MPNYRRNFLQVEHSETRESKQTANRNQTMKPTSQIIIFTLAILTSMASAHAASPREELTQMVEQLQKSPSDNALREKIIKLAQGVKPAPAIPEEAQRREGRAKFAFKSAKSNDDYLSAAREYEEAVRVAPWIPGYYSDLCTIYEKAEKYVEAKRHCEFSLVGLTDPSQVNEIRQRIAGLEFGIEKAGAEKNLARAAAIAAEERKKNSVEGYWFNTQDSRHSPSPYFQIERVGDVLVAKPGEHHITIVEAQITETSVRIKGYFLPGINVVILLVLDLRGGDLVGTTTTHRTNDFRMIRKPWPAK